MNQLFPIYLKLQQLQTLLVGAGPVGLEKLQALLSNSPHAQVMVVAKEISPAFREFANGKPNVEIHERAFQDNDVENKHIIMLASNNPTFNEQVRALATSRHILLNVADKPALCDFYLGSVVQKGNLKIGISSNGKSPTISKRLKEFLQEILPEEIDESLELLSSYRNQLRGNLKEKIKVLNEHTKGLIAGYEQGSRN